MKERDAMSGQGIAVGVRVERDIDGLWFPGVVVRVQADQVDVEYDEDGKVEQAIPLVEIRVYDASRNQNQQPPRSYTSHGHRDESSCLLLQTDYDPNKAPTVVVHNKGEVAGSNGYIINGLETNVAAGNGLRGIRWLRVNT